MKKMGAPVTKDWSLLEADWVAGIKTLGQMADEYTASTGQKISEAGIKKHFDKQGIKRDLSGKIKAAAEHLVNEDLVKELVGETKSYDPKQVVEVNAQNSATIQLAQRKDVTRARAVTTKLLEELEGIIDNKEYLEELGDIMRNPNAYGFDKLNDAYKKIIAFPSRVSGVKQLTEALRICVELERRVYKIDDGVNPDEEIKNINVRFT